MGDRLQPSLARSVALKLVRGAPVGAGDGDTWIPRAVSPDDLEVLFMGFYAAGLAHAAEICGSLAETTYDDTDGFEAATGCEAAIHATMQAIGSKGNG